MSVLGEAFIEIVPNSTGFASKLQHDVKESVDKASEASGGAFRSLAGVGQTALLGLGAAAISGATLALHLADAYEASHARLIVAFKNAGSSVDAYSKQISAADKTNEAYGYSSDQTEAALARLTQATNDPKKAIADLGVAVNLAAARHIDLETAATIVGKVAEGNTSVLKRYGIDLGLAAGGAQATAKAHDALSKAEAALTAVQDKVTSGHLKGAAAAAALQKAHDAVAAATDHLAAVSSAGGLAIDALSNRFGGSAAAQAETFGGKLKALEAQGKDLGIKVGLVLIPIIETLAATFVSVIDYLESHKAVLVAVGVAVGAFLVPAILAATAAWIADAAAMIAANAPLIAIGLLIAGIAAGVVYAYTHFAIFRDVVKTAISDVVGVFHDIAGAWGSFINGFKTGDSAAADGLSGFLGVFQNLGVSVHNVLDDIISGWNALVEGFSNGGALAGAQGVFKSLEQFGGGLRTAFEWIRDNIKPILAGLGIALVVVTSPVLAIVGALAFLYIKFQAVRDVVAGFLKVLGQMVVAAKPIFTALLGVVSGFVSRFSEIFSIIKVAVYAIGVVIFVIFKAIQIFWEAFHATIFRVVMAVWKEVVLGITTAINIVKDIIFLVLDLLTGKWGKVWNDLKDLVSVIWKFIGGTISNGLSIIGNLIASLGGIILRGMVKVPGLIVAGLVGLADLLVGQFVNAFNFVVNSLPGLVGDLISFFLGLGGTLLAGLWSGLQAAWDAGSSFFVNLPSTILSLVGDAASWLLDMGGKVISGLWSGIKVGWAREVHFWSDLPGTILSVAGDVLSWLADMGGKIVSGLVSGFKYVMFGNEGLIAQITALPGEMITAAGDVLSWLVQMGSDVLTGMWNGIKAVWTAEVHFWSDLPGKIVAAAGDVLSWLVDMGVKVISGLVSGIKTAWGLELSFWSGLGQTIIGWIGDAGSWLLDTGSKIIGGLLKGINTAEFFLYHFTVGLPGQILGWIGDASQWLLNVGEQIMTGLLNGITNGFNHVKDFVKGIGSTIVSLKGPPAYDAVMLTPNGQLIMQGLVAGIESQIPALSKTLGRVTAVISPSINAGIPAPSLALANAQAALARAGPRGTPPAAGDEQGKGNTTYQLNVAGVPITTLDQPTIQRAFREMELLANVS